ncbi:MAG TPA: hypothetical protein VGK59_15130 [Ohtaekwangia sp.]
MKTIYTVSVLIVISTAFVLGIFAYTKMNAVHQYDFHRKISRDVVQPDTVIDLGMQAYYVAGITGDKLWLANPRAPRIMLIMHDDKLDTVNINDLPDSVNTIDMRVDSPYFYVMDLVRYDVYRGSLHHMTAAEKILSSTFFSEMMPVSRNSSVLRSIGKRDYAYILEKKSNIGSLNRSAYNLLQKQVDGLFCVDGKLHYDHTLNRLVYLYFYRNEFMVMDTSLNLEYRAHTIDPIQTAQIEVATVTSERAITFSSPPLVVNTLSAVHGHYLFVKSALASRNEDLAAFSKASVFDVYNLYEKGAYVCSFYIPHYADKKINRFAVAQDRLIAIHGSYLVRYGMNISALSSSGP